jgi:hypothetical protein
MVESVSSEGDDRVVNNVENAARHAYRVLTDEEKKLMVEVKDLGQALLEKINGIGVSRELSIARTKAEEAVMWAVKHITA